MLGQLLLQEARTIRWQRSIRWHLYFASFLCKMEVNGNLCMCKAGPLACCVLSVLPHANRPQPLL